MKIIDEVSNHIGLYIAYLHKDHPNMSNLELICASFYLYGYSDFKQNSVFWGVYQDLFLVYGQGNTVSVDPTAHIQKEVDLRKIDKNATVFERYVTLLILNFTANLIFFRTHDVENKTKMLDYVIDSIGLVSKNFTSGMYFINLFPDGLSIETIASNSKKIANNKQFLDSIRSRASDIKKFFKNQELIKIIDSVVI